jgi:hypothetical protein
MVVIALSLASSRSLDRGMRLNDLAEDPPKDGATPVEPYEDRHGIASPVASPPPRHPGVLLSL